MKPTSKRTHKNESPRRKPSNLRSHKTKSRGRPRRRATPAAVPKSDKINQPKRQNILRPVTNQWLQTVWLQHGDAKECLTHVPTNTPQTCVTSPPYWQLRDYGLPDQLGTEPTPEEYVDRLAGVFDEVYRVLRDDGTLWLNLGDTYCGGGGFSPNSPTNRYRGRQSKASKAGRRPVPPGYQSKDLVGIPWMVAFELRRRGWILRCDVIWDKPDAWGNWAHDRPTRSHEYLFLFSKSKKYRYDPEVIREAAVMGTKHRRSVWSIPKSRYRGNHSATFPEKLVERCILASTKPNQIVIDPFMGSGTTGVVARRLGRFFTGFDINRDYVKEAMRRING